MTITSCRLLISIGTCLSLWKEKLLHWSFSVLTASLEGYMLSWCSGHVTHNVGLALLHISLSSPMSCMLALFHSAYYGKSQHTRFTACSSHVGSVFPFLQWHVGFSLAIKGWYNTQQDHQTDIGRASHWCQANWTIKPDPVSLIAAGCLSSSPDTLPRREDVQEGALREELGSFDIHHAFE